MTSPRISTSVADIFTRSFVIPNDVSFIFKRKPNGSRYVACISAKGSNNRPLFVCADGFIKIIDIAAAWVEDKCLLSERSTFSEISNWEDNISGSNSCLLYTSDAADERSSVDLGGRRIIKKKKKTKQHIHLKP